MKKGTKLVALLLGIALVAPACNNKPSTSQAPVESSSISGETSNSSSSAAQESSSNTPSSSTSSEAPVNYTVTISNKTALQADWFVGDAARKVEISVEPRANVTQLVSEGKIVITSSDATKVSVVGQMATPVAEGQVTLTVRCGQSQDTVAINLQAKQTTKTKYGVEHEGTAEDPFTNEDAVRVAKQTDKYNGEDFYVRGEVETFYHAPGSRTDGAVSWYYKPATAGGDRFEVYKCYKAEGTGSAKYLTDDDIWVGAIVTAHGKFTYYNNTQAETDGAAVFVKAEGEKPAPRTTVEKTFAEALAAGIALADGADTYDYYKFDGYVSAKSGNNYFLTATKGEALVTATSDEAHQSREYYSNAIELFFSTAPSAEIAAKLLEGAKVEVTTVIKNYHGTVENCFALTNDDIVVKEPGTAWAIPEPEVATKTVTEFAALEDNGKKEKAYTVTAEIKSWKNATAAKDKYGNMVITDGTTDLIIYGATATTTALAWDNASAYAFSNPNDFLTNTVTQALAVGNTITMKLVRNDYTDKNTGNVTIEGSGVITNVVAVATTAIALKASEEVEVGKTVTLTATRTPENSNTPCEWISSDATVATVEGGVVTGVAAGTAVITAKISDEIKAECTVTVKAVEGNILALENLGTNVAGDYVDAETEAAVGDYTMVYNNAKKQGSSILLKKNTGYLYFKAAVPGAIKKITLYANSGASGSAKYGIAFSATAITAKVAATNYTNIKGGESGDFACAVANATYFCVSVDNSANGQVLKLEVQYE